MVTYEKLYWGVMDKETDKFRGLVFTDKKQAKKIAKKIGGYVYGHGIKKNVAHTRKNAKKVEDDKVKM